MPRGVTEESNDVRRHRELHTNRMGEARERIYDEFERIEKLSDPDKKDAAWEATKRYTRELESIK